MKISHPLDIENQLGVHCVKIYNGPQPSFSRKAISTLTNGQWQELCNRILLVPTDPPSLGRLDKIVDINYEPGTFLLSERAEQPAFLYEDERKGGLEGLVCQVVMEDLARLDTYAALDCTMPAFQRRISEEVFGILTHATEQVPSLASLIWNQEYSDIIRRIEMLVLTGDPDFDVHIYADVNRFAKQVCLSAIQQIEARRDIGIQELCRFSVSAGLVGLNTKSPIEATSHFDKQCAIPLLIETSVRDNATHILDSLLTLARRRHHIDETEELLIEVCDRAGHGPVSIAVFTDDYIETLFLLKFYEALMNEYKNLFVCLIPKSRHCGNDATYLDITEALAAPKFYRLKYYQDQGRFMLRSDGPCLGGLNLFKLPITLLQDLMTTDLLDIRGCRAFEMSQGLNKPTFFSFNVCREISESLTGLDGESQHMVLVRQNPGDKSFCGFRERHRRTLSTPSGRQYMVAPFTVQDYLCAREERRGKNGELGKGEFFTSPSRRGNKKGNREIGDEK
ncbi:MAG: hypothetical protein BA863_04395 [Desulfovibrio sp. S3730MH75]|nr:MAG: hypothetical protein BA863_04395 [Desulfovibrio sp. S3730MH75]